MPLTILLSMVIIGIAGLVGLVHLLGYSRAYRFDDAGDVMAQWLRHWPDDRVIDVTLCQSRSAALVHAANGPGLVWAFGADTTARYLHGATVDPTVTGLLVHLPDFAAPSVKIDMTPDEATLWAGRIEAEAA